MQMTRLMGLQAREMPLCSLQFGQLQVRLIYISSTKQHPGRHPTTRTRSFSCFFHYLSRQPPCHQPPFHQPINPSTHLPWSTPPPVAPLPQRNENPPPTDVPRCTARRRPNAPWPPGTKTGGKDVLHDMFGGKVSRATKKIYEIGMNE